MKHAPVSVNISVICCLAPTTYVCPPRIPPPPLPVYVRPARPLPFPPAVRPVAPYHSPALPGAVARPFTKLHSFSRACVMSSGMAVWTLRRERALASFSRSITPAGRNTHGRPRARGGAVWPTTRRTPSPLSLNYEWDCTLSNQCIIGLDPQKIK